MEVLKIILLISANTLVCNVLAFWFTDKTEIKLKPFGCYGCLAFWLSFLGGSAITYFTSANELAYFASFLAGMANYFYVKSKYQIYE